MSIFLVSDHSLVAYDFRMPKPDTTVETAGNAVSRAPDAVEAVVFRHYLGLLRTIVVEVVDPTPTTGEDRLGRLVETVARELSWDVCSIYLLDRASESLDLAATYGLDPTSVGHVRLPLAEGLVGAAAREEVAVFLEHAADDPRYKYLPETGEEKFMSLAAVPFRRNGSVAGVFTVQTIQAYAFSTADRHFLEILAGQIGTVVEVALALRAAAPRRARAVLGSPAAPGSALARVRVLASSPDRVEIHAHGFRGAEIEMNIITSALQTALAELDLMTEQLVAGAPAAAQIFTAHRMILEDPSFLRKVTDNILTGQESAPRAVAGVMDEYIARFAALENAILREKAQDIKDLRDLLLRIMGETTAHSAHPDDSSDEETIVIVARELTPQQAIRLDPEKVVAIVTECGSEFSHAAIVARAQNIPAVVGAEGLIDQLLTGDTLLVDGDSGFVFINPEKSMVDEYFGKTLASREREAAVRDALTSAPPADDLDVDLDVNIGLPFEIETARNEHAHSVGLLRTEFFYMQQEDWPSETQQAVFYSRVIRSFPDGIVTIRLLDIGGDKFLPYMGAEREENPHLGVRSIRYLLDNPEILRSQLRAIHLAARECGAQPRILVPMVTHAWEMIAVRETMLESTEGVSYPLGLMIEVPSALFHIADLMAHADYASIGTNDLAQYLLALDRNNARIKHLFHPLHPGLVQALSRLHIDLVETGKPFAVCGELAADPLAATALLAMGYRALSVAPARLPEMRYLVHQLTAAHLLEARAALTEETDPANSERRIRAILREHAPLVAR